MAYRKVQIYRGLEQNIPTLAEGEPAFTTDQKNLYLGTSNGNVRIGEKVDGNLERKDDLKSEDAMPILDYANSNKLKIIKVTNFISELTRFLLTPLQLEFDKLYTTAKLKLNGYVKGANSGALISTDTVNIAFGKVENKIQMVEEKANQQAAEIANKAPGGFGLGTSCVLVPNNNWNDTNVTGFYMGANIANAPDGGWWMGYVIVHNADWRHQVINDFATTRRTMERFKYSGTWTGWTPIYTACTTTVSPYLPATILGEGIIHQTYE